MPYRGAIVRNFLISSFNGSGTLEALGSTAWPTSKNIILQPTKRNRDHILARFPLSFCTRCRIDSYLGFHRCKRYNDLSLGRLYEEQPAHVGRLVSE